MGPHERYHALDSSLIDTSIPGVYTSTGRVVGHSGTVSLTVTVGAYDIIGIDDMNITVSQGQDFSMPETVVATIKVGEHIFTQNVSVVWDDVIDSATIGEFQTMAQWKAGRILFFSQ